MTLTAIKSKSGKISEFYILTLPHPQGHVMSVKCEQPLDGLAVKVWLLYDHPTFNIALCKLKKLQSKFGYLMTTQL